MYCISLFGALESILIAKGDSFQRLYVLHVEQGVGCCHVHVLPDKWTLACQGRVGGTDSFSTVFKHRVSLIAVHGFTSEAGEDMPCPLLT